MKMKHEIDRINALAAEIKRIGEEIAAICAEDDDPTPYCACGARDRLECGCADEK